MKITVHYLAQLKSAAGAGSETVELAASASLQDLIRQLAVRHGGAFQRIVLDGDGQLQSSILLFVGSEQVRWEPRRLKEGDEVTVLAPMAGG